MNFKKISYYRSISTSADLPDDQLPQFAFIGRSNVGKSSFINSITGQKDLARTGSTPGLTKKVNLFLTDNKFYLADLPGYGYAKMMKGERKKLEELIFWFLTSSRDSFRQVFLLVDAEVGPTANDLDVIEFLDQENFPTTIVASKIDRIKPAQRHKAISNIVRQIPQHFEIIPFSSKNGQGKQEILEIIKNSLKS
jgi:GTP-binding protein